MPSVIKKLPHYTYEDYLNWEGRWELMEGHPYAMSPSPSLRHQDINGKLWSVFNDSLQRNCRHCKVYLPIDWKVNDDTVVQPDLLIICKKTEKKFLDFVPPLVVEILSPSTAFKDRNDKFALYEMQGVKYYLIVDAQFKKIEVYELIDGKYQPVAVTPEEFDFSLGDDCKLKVHFDNIWE
jgi:Uma2 family endonuclease